MEKNNETALGMTKKERMKDVLFFALSFFVPLVLMMLIWNSIGISYGGQVTPLIYDLEAQIVPFMAGLRYVLDGTQSLFFTWGNALGGNFYGTWAYYMASPLSWFTVLFDIKSLPEAVYLLSLVRVGLCGITFAAFLRFGLAGERCRLVSVIFPCCYALMSYNIMYSSCPMWIDGVIMLPLVLLGVERLIKGKRGYFYFGVLIITFVCSYYISYIVGIFAAVYLLCRVFSTKTKAEIKDSIAIIVRFGVLSLLAIGVAMPVLLPALKSISQGKEVVYGGVNSIMPGAYDTSWVEKVQKLMPGQYDSIENAGAPSVYCGTLMLVLAVVFLFQKKHSVKEKVCYVVLLLFSVIGFFNRYVDYAYHVFKYPNCYPYRYAFLFSAVILMMAWHAFQNIPRNTEFSGLLTGIGVVYLCIELFFNGTAIVTGLHKETAYTVRSAWNLMTDYCQPLVEEIKKDEEFGRTAIGFSVLRYNGTQLYGLNGANSFVSTFNNNVNVFYYVMGARHFSIMADSEAFTPLTDSLLGIKYRIDQVEEMVGYEMKKVAEVETGAGTGKMYLHENKNALSLGYMVPAEGGRFVFGEDAFANQNMLISDMVGENVEVFKPIPFSERTEDGKVHLEFVAQSDRILYAYVTGERLGDERLAVEAEMPFVVKADGEEKIVYGYEFTNLCLGNYKNGEQIDVVIDEEILKYNNAYIYEFDAEAYELALEELRDEELQVQSCRNGKIKGTVTAKEDGILMLTLPVDAGYKVKVDGAEVPYGMAIGTFLSVMVEKGEHTIEIDYVAPGFETGMKISLLSFALFLVCFWAEIRKNRRVLVDCSAKCEKIL